MINLLLVVIYIAFISLGLPDGLLGSAWPVLYTEIDVPFSYAGIISMIISAGTIISSLQSDRLTRKLGAGKVTAISVAITAAALFGFSNSHSFFELCMWSIPYGLGAGSVDAALNNYVALHYASRHMSWLHCMWGLGASIGPYIMGYVITSGYGWNVGYGSIGVFQIILTIILVLSLPLWKNTSAESDNYEINGKALTLSQIIKISGVKEIMITFFCYCALEQTTGLWASSYLNLHQGISSEKAAGYAGIFYLGITIGRAISGFITMKLDDTKMIRFGQGIIILGIVILLFSFNEYISLTGIVMIGLGCAPVYPCIIHSTPEHFGEDKSQAIIGIQMACAYLGTLLMPSVFGFFAEHISISLYPFYLLGILILMFIMHERLLCKLKK